MTDPQLFLLSLGYVIVVLATAEFIRGRYQLPGDFTRKFVHIAIGTWSIPTFTLFTAVGWAVALPALFVGVNALSYKLKFFRAIEEEGGRNLGTILFPLAFAMLILIFWNSNVREAPMMGLMALAWGDAFAAIIGRRYGKMRYRIFGEERSLEGSFAMYIFSFLAGITVLSLRPLGLTPMYRSEVATVVAVGCTLIEAMAIRGTDNLFIPVGGAGIAWLLLQHHLSH